MDDTDIMTEQRHSTIDTTDNMIGAVKDSWGQCGM